MDYFEKDIKDKIDIIKKEIAQIDEKLKNIDSMKRYGKVTKKFYNSDTGYTEAEEAKGLRDLTEEEKRIRYDSLKSRKETLLLELRDLRTKLDIMEYDKPENVENRKIKKIEENKRKKENDIKEKIKTHEQEYKELFFLTKMLYRFDYKDLATDLETLTYAHKRKDAPYVQEGIDLKVNLDEMSKGRQLTKKELRETKRGVIRLSRNATFMAKKYKGLYNMFLMSYDIVRDLKKRGIDPKIGMDEENLRIFEECLNNPSTLLYQSMEFYRSKEDKYNKRR